MFRPDDVGPPEYRGLAPLIDLHVHTTASDGTRTPEQTVERAAELCVGVLGICDHDTVSGLPEAKEAAARLGVELVSAVEINCDHGEEEVHLLGYFVDEKSPTLTKALERLRRGRMERLEKILGRLREIGRPVALETVMHFARGEAVGRPHIAQALVEAGHVKSVFEAFDRFLARGGAAYVPRICFTPAEAIAAISSAGGIPILAHPGKLRDEGLLNELVEQGLEGIEVYYPDHAPEQVRRLKRMAVELGLLMSGGTDSHGPEWPKFVEIGSVHVPTEVWEKLRERGLRPSRDRRADA